MTRASEQATNAASNDWRQALAAADARIAQVEALLIVCADDRARVIAAEVERRGSQRKVANELNVSDNTISKAVARARGAGGPVRQLPPSTFERLLAAELTDLAPMDETQWRAVAFVVRGLWIDESWIAAPAVLLAEEIADADQLDDAGIDTSALAALCRGWSRAQALAVIDACQRGDLTVLPHPIAATGPDANTAGAGTC